MFTWFRQKLGFFFLTSTLSIPSGAHAVGDNLLLPDLGGASSGLISPAQEYELGQKWLRIYRSQVYSVSDPFVQEYLERLIRKIALKSQLKDKRLDIIVVDNPTLNAFAVPGGVVGIHTGLFKFAKDEHQLASVVAHELAHISQRHYARQLLEQKEHSIPTLAGLLASILIAATAGGEAGIAAISAVQASKIESQLRFNRQMEQEADRIGMDTLARAGMDPFAMPKMFEQMQRASRFQRKPPEFLLTHPLTESRISDTQLRAQQFPKKQYVLSEEFQLTKVRVILDLENNGKNALRQFEQEIKSNNYSASASKYGLALAHKMSKNYDQAIQLFDELLASNSTNPYYIIAKAESLDAKGETVAAIKILEQMYEEQPSYHPLNIRYAEFLMKQGDYDKCEQVLKKHSLRRPKDDYIWYLLAEVHGLRGDIFNVHTARAEYFLLNGLFDKTEIQLENALKLAKGDKFLTAKLEQKLKTTKKLKKEFTE